MPLLSHSKRTPLEFHSSWRSLFPQSRVARTSTPSSEAPTGTSVVSKCAPSCGGKRSLESASLSPTTAPTSAVVCAFSAGVLIGMLVGLVLSCAITALDLPRSPTPQKWNESQASSPFASPPFQEFSHGHLPF